ncbi:MAG: alpha/beta fold hydrolase, partial [Actinomycetota bacterium]
MTVRDTEADGEVQIERIAWHDQEIVFKRSGDGEPVVLIHGIAGSFDTWDPVLGELGRTHYTISPDLPGHGRAPKPRGDYSLGAFATAIRDLLGALDVPSATIVGHSLGGGIALQFVYQYPELCERLVLVSSGGLGPEVSPILRAATLPGSELFLRLATSDRVENAARS